MERLFCQLVVTLMLPRVKCLLFPHGCIVAQATGFSISLCIVIPDLVFNSMNFNEFDEVPFQQY